MKKKAPSACRALPMHGARGRLQPRRGFSLFFQLLLLHLFFFPQRAEMSGDAINTKKIVTIAFCLIGGRRDGGYPQGSQALQRSPAPSSSGGRGQLGDGTVPRVPGLAGWRARRGGRPSRGPRGCTWLSPAPPEPAAPAPPLGPPGRADRGSSGVCRALSAFRSLAGSLCKPSGVARTAWGAAGPRSPGAQVVARGFPAGAAPGA